MIDTRSLPEDVQATFAATLVDEWVRGGVSAAVVCPGSRSTPLALALADHPGLTVQVHHDERSGGFLALGLALASARPVIVLTTSGTAAVELHPAVTEAHHAGVPLLVCTADRPPELQDVGAPQTIDQRRLYGQAVRWFGDPGVADAAGAHRWRAFAARALASTVGPRPGPVHLNMPFREPLVGTAGPLPAPRDGGAWTLMAGRPQPDGAALDSLWERINGRRGLILAGHPGPDPDDLVAMARRLRWPVAADPRSTAWVPSDVAVVHLDGILRSERARVALVPEVILRLGAPPSSRVVNEWCAASGAEEIVVSSDGWSDPAGTAAVVVSAHPADVVSFWQTSITSAAGTGDWLERWQAASAAAVQAVDTAAVTLESPNEPGIARDVVTGLPDRAQLVVSSSMPIRDVERYASPRRNVRVWSNRGANGIDGVVSTAIGVALGSSGPTGLLIGDIALLHDSNGLLGAAERGVDLVCVVVDNDGGGIFSFLPQAGQLPEARFELLFGTPHGVDLVALAAAYDVEARRLEADAGLVKAVAEAADQGGVHVLVVATDRAANVEAHGIIDDATAAAVDTALKSYSP